MRAVRYKTSIPKIWQSIYFDTFESIQGYILRPSSSRNKNRLSGITPLGALFHIAFADFPRQIFVDFTHINCRLYIFNNHMRASTIFYILRFIRFCWPYTLFSSTFLSPIVGFFCKICKEKSREAIPFKSDL